MGLTRPRVEHCLLMMTRIERMLVGICTYLTYGGKLLMVKVALSSLPIFFICCPDIPKTLKL